MKSPTEKPPMKRDTSIATAPGLSISPANPSSEAKSSQSAMTFDQVQREIDARRIEFAKHPFLQRLEADGTWADARIVAEKIAFFVLGFQDIIRIIAAKVREPALVELAKANAEGDRGHDRWFLQDMKVLGAKCSVEDLFSPTNAAIRDVTYTLVGDALCARHDSSRFALALCLESTGAEFFSRMISCLERMGHDDELIFFGRHHQAVEQSHEIFQAEGQRSLSRIIVPTEAVTELRAVVDRAFAVIAGMASHVEGAIAASREKREPARDATSGQLFADALKKTE
jgi:hypothetical protein